MLTNLITASSNVSEVLTDLAYTGNLKAGYTFNGLVTFQGFIAGNIGSLSPNNFPGRSISQLAHTSFTAEHRIFVSGADPLLTFIDVNSIIYQLIYSGGNRVYDFAPGATSIFEDTKDYRIRLWTSPIPSTVAYTGTLGAGSIGIVGSGYETLPSAVGSITPSCVIDGFTLTSLFTLSKGALGVVRFDSGTPNVRAIRINSIAYYLTPTEIPNEFYFNDGGGLLLTKFRFVNGESYSIEFLR